MNRRRITADGASGWPGFELRVNGLAHGDRLVFLNVPNGTRKEPAAGRAWVHRVRSESGWVKNPARGKNDVSGALEVFAESHGYSAVRRDVEA